MLQVFLRQSSEEFNGGKLCFRSSNVDTITEEALINEIAEFNTTITQADTLAVLNIFKTVLAKYLEKGYAVQTPFGMFYACAKGTAETKDEQFLPSSTNTDHDIRIHYRPKTTFSEEVKSKMETERVSNSLKTRVFIDSVHNASGIQDAKIKAGECISLYGEYLKFEKEDPEQGIFLENEKESVRLDYYIRNTKGIITARINPEITAGSYSLKLVNRPTTKLCTTDFAELVEIG